MSALPGIHYCKDHQGNSSHYDKNNCVVCNSIRKEDLIAFIKENLHIEVKEDTGCSCCYGPPGVTVSLVLCGEKISSDGFSLPSCDCNDD